MVGPGAAAVIRVAAITAFTMFTAHWLDRQLTFLPCLACRLSSLSLKFKMFTKISRCSFLIICSWNSLSQFGLPTEMVLHLSKVFFIISASSLIPMLLDNIKCPRFMLHISYFILFFFTSSWSAARAGWPQELANGHFHHPADPGEHQLSLESCYTSRHCPSPSTETGGAQRVGKSS